MKQSKTMELRDQKITPAEVEQYAKGRTLRSNAEELAEIYFVDITADSYSIHIETGYITQYQQKLFELIFNTMVRDIFDLPEGGVYTQGGRCSVDLFIGMNSPYWDDTSIPEDQRRPKYFARNINLIIDWTGKTERTPPESQPVNYKAIWERIRQNLPEILGKDQKLIE